MAHGPRFWLDGVIHDPGPVDPTATLLDHLRYRLRRTGTKEGCAEGDCGACTVLVGELDAAGETIAWRALNACILFLPMLDGRALLTVESLGGDDPVQTALVAQHGSQCGFCTPGFVMSLYGRSVGAAGTRGVPAADVIAGNLCRCTGYGPILAAAAQVPPVRMDDGAIVAALTAIRRDTPLDYSEGGRRWFAPRTIAQLAAHLTAHPEARIVAGATDVGLWVTKQHRVLDHIVWIGEVDELRAIDDAADALTLGAGVRYGEAYAALARLHPDLGELLRRLGAVQVRNAGTIGGNIANGSPIGDMPPALIALGATLLLRQGETRRTFPLEDYFIAYGQQDRRPGEFVEAIRIPRPAPATLIHIAKLSKRFDSDISAVCAAFALDIEEDIVTSARLAFGGMAGIPKRAPASEAALVGSPWSAASVERAAAALAEDFTPLDDVRGSSAYRLAAAGNLLRRLWHRSARPGEPAGVLALTADG